MARDPSKTETATQKRRDKAREKGSVPRSQELPKLTVLVAGLLTLRFGIGFFTEQLREVFVLFLGGRLAFTPTPDNVTVLFWVLTKKLAFLLLPILTVMPALSRMLRVKPLTPDTWPGAVHLFVGPSGAGKTTSLLRLALAARAEAPGREVLVVNADGGRGKGRLVLRHYAELSGLTYVEADGPEDWDRLFAKAEAGAAVFADTPGFRREGELAAWCRDMEFLTDKKNTETLKKDVLSVINQFIGAQPLDNLLIEEYLVK